MDKGKYISAGINYIYELDEYPASSVYDQIAKELDEVLGLNKQEILEKRSDYFGIGHPSDYLNRLIETSEGEVIAGIRHLGGDNNKPFIFVWPSFKITSTQAIASEILPCFEVFSPKAIAYWTRPDCNDTKEKIFQQRFIGRIAQMNSSAVVLSKVDNYYEWYRSEYELFHLEMPEYVNRITVNSKETMDASYKENLLFLLIHGEEKIGLISGATDHFLDMPAIYLNEILISQQYRGKGYASQLLSGFISVLVADYFMADIDADNIPSTSTALTSGQKIFSQEIVVQI